MAEDYVIPPGQEDLLGAMLGKDGGLPGNCTLSTGDVQKTIVRATYACPKGDVVVELTHPDVAAAGTTRTEKFGVRIESGTPPSDFQNALLARIRERETDFRWTIPPPPPVVPDQPPRPVPGLSGAVVLVLLLLVVLLLWRRRGRAKAG
jgi:hypothetical protein